VARDPRRLALDYLAGHNVMTLATSGADGVWAAAVFYASAGFDLFFISAGHTRHGQNLAANPRAAAAIHEDYADWMAIRGVQLEGGVVLLAGHEQQAAMAVYQAKFPYVAAPADERMRAALPRMGWYRLRPVRLYWIDNSQGLGHRDEIDLFGG
jgi:uncharacterized protein YhbP (UPF0306 family)